MFVSAYGIFFVSGIGSCVFRFGLLLTWACATIFLSENKIYYFIYYCVMRLTMAGSGFILLFSQHDAWIMVLRGNNAGHICDYWIRWLCTKEETKNRMYSSDRQTNVLRILKWIRFQVWCKNEETCYPKQKWTISLLTKTPRCMKKQSKQTQDAADNAATLLFFY